MLKWLLVLLLVVVASGLIPRGGPYRFRLGELPGDLSITLWGRRFHFPFASTLLLSGLVWLLLRIL